LAEIGRFYGVSREYIRQLLKTPSKGLFNDKEWTHYPLKSAAVITQDDAIYTDVVNNEKADVSFELFARICSWGFHFSMVKVNGMLFLINNRFNSQLIEKACGEIERLKGKTRTETVLYKTDAFLKEVAANRRSEYKKVLATVIAKACGLDVDEEGNVVFQKNGFSVADELCDILLRG
jgi:hypothetical protein